MVYIRHSKGGRLTLCGATAAAMLMTASADAGEAATARTAEAPDFIVVSPVKLDIHPQGRSMPNATGCAIDIDDGENPTQRVITVGVGETEALSCVRFVAAGPLPLPRSLGLIYDFESGPNRVFRTALIVSQDSETGVWSMNEDHPDLIVTSEFADLESLRGALENR